jgi:hypothetical protein
LWPNGVDGRYIKKFCESVDISAQDLLSSSNSEARVREHHCDLIQAALWRRILEMATMAADKIVPLQGVDSEHQAAQSPPRNRQRVAGGVTLESLEVEGAPRKSPKTRSKGTAA